MAQLEENCSCAEDTQQVDADEFQALWDSIAGTLLEILYIYHLIEQRNSNVNYEIAQGWGYKTSINPGNSKGVIVMSKIDAD
ncbi:hypothetical protein PQG02_25500 [Nostoc sp. UHCC 0926]|uniref:hypothetical protein n=1 Tax=unclassified Nostoc TaxID=2593658 RepID=UPI002360DE44|nr:hypothetical protein [Nostoc sp. UHCC 0926]WDD31998.1 hypothetical protein PQG02_25500 [Nostoc sp. UHCC 0926]